VPTLADEVRRNLAVYSGQVPQHPVRAVYVAGGDEHAALRDRLTDLLGVPVHEFDPFAGATLPGLPADGRGAFAAAVGLLGPRADRRPLPIDFVHPKEPKPPRDVNKRRLVAAAAVLGALLAGASAYCYSQLAARDQELDALFTDKTDLERRLGKLEEDTKSVKALDDWSRGEIVWLDELYDLTDRSPDPNSLRVLQLTGDPLTRKGKDKLAARMTLKGITSSDFQPVDRLMNELVQDGHYRVEPKVLSRNTGVDRFRFPQQFTTRVDVEKLAPGQYTRRITEEPTGRGRRGGGDGMDFGAGGFGGGQP
jgi:hypothetical protein